MNLLNVSYTQKYSVFAEDEMSFSYVVEEGLAEEVLKCNESEKWIRTCAKPLVHHVHTLKKVFLSHLLQLIQILPFNQLIPPSQILPHTQALITIII